MCSIDFGALRSVLRILIFNVGLYVVDYALDIKQYLYHKNRGHRKWAYGILLVTFLPNVVGFIYWLVKAVSLIERYSMRKYEAFYHMEWDWKKHRIYHVYMDETYRKWENLPSGHKLLHMSKIYFQHWCIAILILFLSVLAVCLAPFVILALIVFKCFGLKVTEIATEYLDRNLYGWMIGYNRVIDAKAHNKQQRGTDDMLFDLLFKDR